MALTDRRCFYCQSTDPEHNGVCCRCEHSGRSHEDWARGEGDQGAEVCCDSDDYAGHICTTCHYQHCHCPGGMPGPIHSGEGDRPDARNPDGSRIGGFCRDCADGPPHCADCPIHNGEGDRPHCEPECTEPNCAVRIGGCCWQVGTDNSVGCQKCCSA